MRAKLVESLRQKLWPVFTGFAMPRPHQLDFLLHYRLPDGRLPDGKKELRFAPSAGAWNEDFGLIQG
jgi:hypothetical protein